MAKKISKFNINGIEIQIDDKDAVQREDLELEDGDILVYNQSQDKFIPAKLVIPEVDNQLDENSNNAISNKAVTLKVKDLEDAISELEQNTNKPLLVNYSYDLQTREITASIIPSQEEGGWIKLTDDLNILLITLNSTYDQNSEVYSVSNILGYIKIDSNALSGKFVIPSFSENRIVYFILLNSMGINNQIRKSLTNSLVIPGIGSLTRNTISVLSTVMTGDNNCILLQAERTLDVDIEVKVTVYGGPDGNKVTSINSTIPHGSNSQTINLGSSIYTRRASIEILSIGSGSIYFYELNTNNVTNIPGYSTAKYIYIKGHNDSNTEVWFDAIVTDDEHNPINVTDYENIKVVINISKSPVDSSYPFINIEQGEGATEITSSDSRAADSQPRPAGQDYFADIYFDNTVSDPSDNYILMGYTIDNDLVPNKVSVPYHEI